MFFLSLLVLLGLPWSVRLTDCYTMISVKKWRKSKQTFESGHYLQNCYLLNEPQRYEFLHLYLILDFFHMVHSTGMILDGGPLPKFKWCHLFALTDHRLNKWGFKSAQRFHKSWPWMGREGVQKWHDPTISHWILIYGKLSWHSHIGSF